MRITTLSSAAALLLATACHLEFEVQPYELPDNQGYRHPSAIVHDHELILFGGLGNGGPFPPTPMNHNVYTLDLKADPDEREWTLRHTDTVVGSPWFTSTRGFVEIDGDFYVACDDADANAVYAFDPEDYTFEHLSTSDLPEEINGGDCCAVGVKVPSEDSCGDDDECVYILGGRNNYTSPMSTVRYYSVTHDEWVQVEDMHVARSHLGCAAVDGHRGPKLYAVGGGDAGSGEALSSVEVYDVARDRWRLHEDVLSVGRTRINVQAFGDDYLVLLGGDLSCAGGGAGNNCAPDTPTTTVEVLELDHGLRRVPDALVPQLNHPRQTPAAAIHKTRHGYELYVIAGRSIDDEGLSVLTSTEVLSLDLKPGRRH